MKAAAMVWKSCWPVSVAFALMSWSGGCELLGQSKEAAQGDAGTQLAVESDGDAVDFDNLLDEYESRQKAMLEKLRADPAWQGTHVETSVIKPVGDSGLGSIHNFCLDLDGNLLVCCEGKQQSPASDIQHPRGHPVKNRVSSPQIRVVAPDGRVISRWTLESQPQAICVRRDGTVFVGGDGRIVKLSRGGDVLATADSPAIERGSESEEVESQDDAARETESKSVFEALIDAFVSDSSSEADRLRMRQELKEEMLRRQREITGIAVTDQDLFVACPAREGFGYSVWRLDHQLQNATRIVKGLRGCCGQMDIQAKDGELWVAENGRHRVVRYDRDGKQLASFGKRGREKPDCFGGCCEPKNLRFGSDGSVYVAESGPPMVVKRFSLDGEFLGVVGMPSFQTGCVRVTVEVSSEGDRVYVLNTGGRSIHVLADRRSTPTHEQVGTIKIPGGVESGDVNTFCLDTDGNLLVGTGKQPSTNVARLGGRGSDAVSAKRAILRISPEGKLLATWATEVAPLAFDVAEDGSIFVAGVGRLARLDKRGHVEKVSDSPHVADLPPLPPEPDTADETKVETPAEKAARQEKISKLQQELQPLAEAFRTVSQEYAANREDEATQKKYQEAVEAYLSVSQELRELTMDPRLLATQRRAAAVRSRSIRSIAVSGKDVFICCPAAKGYGFDVWRTDRDFGPGKKIVTGLRGCCGNMYIQAHQGRLWVAENARKRVIAYDRDGNELTVFGSSDRKAIDGFGSCCNPMCIRIAPDGTIFTAESNVGHIKRFSPTGEFLGLVGTVKIVPGCKHVPIGISNNGDHVYMLDLTRAHVIVMEQVSSPREASQ